jgi:tRNA threonylcarbamoyl adenosine modification protein (Sua5/YciO/YrdC/YwlC family)
VKVIQPEEMDVAVHAVEAGKLVVVPTHRWYMICANASNMDACERIFSGKQRLASKSLVYVLPTADTAAELFALTPQAERLAAAFWPGDLAMILPWRDAAVGCHHQAVGAVNALVTYAPGVLGELAARSEVPIAATTVNISGDGGLGDPGPAITTAEVSRFVDTTGIQIAYCIDGGICPIANHLTIVDCTTTEGRLIRSGVIHDRAIMVAMEPLIESQP